MLFNSPEFLIFLPVCFAVFWLCPKKWRWIPLLAASYVFYAWWNVKLLCLILLTTAVSYAAGILMEKAGENRRLRGAVFLAATLICFGVLLFFKYFAFLWQLAGDVSEALFSHPFAGSFSVLLPVGISFYTFQTASYVADVYRGTVKAEWHAGYFALFVTFFPQLVAGPIERPQDLLPQLRDTTPLCRIEWIPALRLLLVGFFKKIAVADVVGIFVNRVYGDLSAANGVAVLVATLLFSVQIFCDFSGYSDIAVGCALLFGVRLTENFKSPYRSASIAEFWNRWHISLSTWLRDYIYIPLGGNRVSAPRWCFNVMVVFLVSGLWHGAAYTFLLWGALHGVYRVVGKLTRPARDKFLSRLHVNAEGKPLRVFRTFVTFLLVTFAWIFFRADSVGDAFLAVKRLFAGFSLSAASLSAAEELLAPTTVAYIYVPLAIAALFFCEKLKNLGREMPENAGSRVFSHTVPRFIAYILLLLSTLSAWIYLQAADVGSSFIYFQF